MSQEALVAVTYFNVVIVSENHLRFVNNRHIRVNVW